MKALATNRTVWLGRELEFCCLRGPHPNVHTAAQWRTHSKPHPFHRGKHGRQGLREGAAPGVEGRRAHYWSTWRGGRIMRRRAKREAWDVASRVPAHKECTKAVGPSRRAMRAPALNPTVGEEAAAETTTTMGPASVRTAAAIPHAAGGERRGRHRACLWRAVREQHGGGCMAFLLGRHRARHAHARACMLGRKGSGACTHAGTHAHAHTRTRAHAHTRTRAHARTHTVVTERADELCTHGVACACVLCVLQHSTSAWSNTRTRPRTHAHK
jgi:hypothetical protein